MFFSTPSGKREKSITLSKLPAVKNPPNGSPNWAALKFFLFLIPPTNPNYKLIKSDSIQLCIFVCKYT